MFQAMTELEKMRDGILGDGKENGKHIIFHFSLI